MIGAMTRVYLEVGRKRVFAGAPDWPGWCRSAKTEDAALQALADYHPRYAVVAKRASRRFPRSLADTFEVVERIPGDAATDFGVPGKVAAGDGEPVDAREARRLAGLVRAAWTELDEVAAATPEELRKGPRGGGRDRDKMINHVLAAETSYARKLGVRHGLPALDDGPAVEALRADILAVLAAPSDGTPPVPKGWPVRYAARRIAWHVLDHVWEMQDRTE